MAKDAEGQPIIIKKVKKGGGGHHGGAWKVAYADFVTAMMAFFLLLWLLNATTEEQRRGIADYFDPGFRGSGGAGGILGGNSRAEEGELESASSAPSISIPLPTVSRTVDSEDLAKIEAEGEDEAAEGPREPQEAPDDADRIEQAEFARAEERLRQALQEIPDIDDLAQNLIIDQTPEGLRIQILDQEGRKMFEAGGAEPLPRTRTLLNQVAKVIREMPNKISISGHTDAAPYAAQDVSYGNWELSSDRANASRRVLLESGLPHDRIAWVQGKADQDPLFPDDPTSPRNRRVAIVLLRDKIWKRTRALSPPPPSIIKQPQAQ
jgi:chemotaxis protein MotB